MLLQWGSRTPRLWGSREPAGVSRGRGGPHWAVSESQLESSLTEPPRGLKGLQQPKAGEMPASYIQVDPRERGALLGHGDSGDTAQP